MYLNEQDRAIFFKLYFDLLLCVNKKHKIVKGFYGDRYPKSVDKSDALQVRERLFDNPSWIDEYLAKYGNEFSDEERDVLLSWRDHFIKSNFFVMRNQKKYTVFMLAEGDETTKLYGVVGLNHPISEVLETYRLPAMVNAVILPFRGKIVYDGIMTFNNISFGAGMRGSLNETYRISKEKFGIIESLPFDEASIKTAKKSSTQRTTAKPSAVSQERVDEIACLIIDFCNKHLNSEYTEMSVRLLEKLRRKRPSPLLSGRANTWACGIVYAIGSTNFLFDKTQTPHMLPMEISEHFGISKSTAGNKAGEIRKYFKMHPFDPDWTLPSKLEDNPLVWMFEAKNGIVFDARNAPLKIQEELLESGLIPFIPEKLNETPVESVKKEPKDTAKVEIEGQLKFGD
jgi:hypothetical protein